MASLLGMRLDVAGDAQQADVVDVVAQPLHLGQRLAALHWDDMVAIYAWRNEPAFFSTSFTQPTSPCLDDGLHLRPSWTVEQSLVVFVSAHFRRSLGNTL
jgi:hypothetical protein